MTRIFTDGAEMGDTLFWTGGTGHTAVAVVAPPPSSSYYYQIAGYGGGVYISFSAISECYFRERVKFNSGDINIPSFRNGATTLGYLTLSGSYLAYDFGDGTVLETGTQVINTNQWYEIEIYFKIDDAAGRFVVKLDGLTEIDFTGDTKYGAYTTFDNIAYGKTLTSTIIYLDDLAMNDVNGGVDDSWCGDGIIIKVTPNGNGTHNNWHGSDGNDVNNYELVDEYPHDTDTTYVYHDGAASGTQDQYALSDYDGTNKTITRIYAEARLRKTAASTHTVKLGTLASGGSDVVSAAQNLSTTYRRFVGPEQLVNPVDSGAWEEADIDALEFVVEVG